MDRLEKLIYSVKYLPQILYFGSAVLILLIISIDVTLIELLIPLFIFFIYMTYLASKNYKSNAGMNVLEKFIYSIYFYKNQLELRKLLFYFRSHRLTLFCYKNLEFQVKALAWL